MINDQTECSEVIEEIYLHFDVPEHHLSLDDFINHAKNTRAIIDSFNKEAFSGKLEYKLLVLPPTSGTFLKKLGLAILSVPIVAISGEFANGFIEGLTNHAPSYYGKEAGKWTKEHCSQLREDEQIQKATQKEAAIVLQQLTLNFLQKPTEDLYKIGISEEKFRDAYYARNQFYKTCERMPTLKGIGFDPSPYFPIKRDDFKKFIVELPPQEDEESMLDHDWVVETQNVMVTSPNWDRNDGDDRHWKAKCSNGKIVFFTIEDEAFWLRLLTEDLDPKIYDNMAVQWAYTIGAQNKMKNCRVLKVLDYNGTIISNSLTETELSNLLKKHSIIKESDMQTNIFDYTSCKTQH